MYTVKKAVAWGLVIILALFLLSAIPLYVDWLWFQNLGYGGVFSTILASRIVLGLVVGVIFFAIVWGSAWYALRSSSGRLELYTVEGRLPIFLDRMIRRGVEFIVLFGGIVLSVLVGLEASTHWQSWLQFTHCVPFGRVDPVFGNDIGFYVFRLDFLLFAYRTLMFALIAAAVAAAAVLYLSRTVDILAGKLKITGVAAGQLGFLLVLITLLQTLGFKLYAYNLLFTSNATLYGVGYADAHVRLAAINIAAALAVVGAIVVAYGARRRSLPLVATGILLAPVANIIIGGGVAALVQRLVVNPDEFTKERPYLKRHIQATQAAYGLDSVNRRSFDLTGTLNVQDLRQNRVTLQSVRLWDYEPLHAAYKQLQEIQQYYKFSDVDIDRYTVDGVYRQVMLSARELDKDALPESAQTWVNIRLKYTHGYGLAMSPVNEVSREGLPMFFIKDIPPESPERRFTVKKPQIYFGERTDDHVLVDTRVSEFDYPKGATGVETRYSADSGVPVGGVFRRLALALRFGELNLILPGNLTSSTRILFRRNIVARARTLAPFLEFDSDPYLVLQNGRLVWIQDAYTTSSRYPYAEPSSLIGSRATTDPMQAVALNYIRNSVKVVTDAYSGEVRFYVFAPKDPVIQSYRRMFPGMFRDASEMPSGLRAHVRYPEDLFSLQTQIYTTYHMSDEQQFFTRGDVWAIPDLEQTEVGVDTQGLMEPYYVIMKLPDADREEFIMLMPYRRANKDNMVAWMAAKCDQQDYGRLLVYEFPKGEQFYGPAQIQARANQDTEISQQMTLWNQQKSSVSRGNLLVIPIDNAMLYVEPIYLQSVSTKIPEFKRVIVALGNQITMQPTLSRALDALVGEGAGEAAPESSQPPASPSAPGAPSASGGQASGGPPTEQSIMEEAYGLYEKALAAQRAGDWAEYGKLQKELGNVLRKGRSSP